MPFLDRKVFELARRIPVRLRADAHNTKIAMRRATSLRLRERIVSPSRYTVPESSGS